MTERAPNRFADFIRDATPEEKEAVYMDVMKKATDRQNAMTDRVPLKRCPFCAYEATRNEYGLVCCGAVLAHCPASFGYVSEEVWNRRADQVETDRAPTPRRLVFKYVNGEGDLYDAKPGDPGALVDESAYIKLEAANAELRARIEAMEGALRELVELKDMRDRIDGLQYETYAGYATMSNEYKRRKPAAWDAARAALKEAK